jgi:hypothetical protein
LMIFAPFRFVSDQRRPYRFWPNHCYTKSPFHMTIVIWSFVSWVLRNLTRSIVFHASIHHNCQRDSQYTGSQAIFDANPTEGNESRDLWGNFATGPELIKWGNFVDGFGWNASMCLNRVRTRAVSRSFLGFLPRLRMTDWRTENGLSFSIPATWSVSRTEVSPRSCKPNDMIQTIITSTYASRLAICSSLGLIVCFFQLLLAQ